MTPVFACVAQCHDEGWMHGDLCIENLSVHQDLGPWSSIQSRIKIKGAWMEANPRFNWKRTKSMFRRIVAPEM